MSSETIFNDYYKFKNMYEEQLNKLKHSIIVNPSLSSKEKKQDFKQLKPKCINCKRPVGSIFTNKLNIEKSFRELKAMCGSISDPCNFKIVIQVPETNDILKSMDDFEKELQQYKNEIIENKNKLLFGYINTENSLEEFDKMRTNVEDTTSFLEFFLSKYNEIVDNKEINNETKILKEDIFNNYIISIKNSISEFDKTKNTKYISDAVDIYVNTLTPKLKELMDLKYKYNAVEYNVDTNSFQLIQKKYTITDMEYILDEPKVIEYNVGYQNKKSKTMKNKPLALASKNKTKKNKPLLILDESDGSIENDDKREDVIERSKDVDNAPHYNQDMSIYWTNPNYQSIWNRLSQKYKDVLAADKEWLQDTMDTYVNNKKQGKPIKFVMPSNLNLPPQVLEDGSYDFGNDYINEVFNRLPKIQRDNLLSLKKSVNGQDDYTIFKNNLGNNIIANNLGFISKQI